MQIERIHFEEVFDVAAGDFSFRSEGRTHYGVSLGHGTIPEAGAAYAVAFGRPGDWSSVLGWRDLGSPAVTLKHSAAGLVLATVYDIYWYGLFFFAGGFLFGGIRMALAFAALFIAGLGYVSFRNVQTLRRAKRALRSVGGSGNSLDNSSAVCPGTVR